MSRAPKQSELLPCIQTVEVAGAELDALYARARRGEIFIPIIARTKRNGVWAITYRENNENAKN